MCSEERRKHLLAGTGVDYAEGIKITDPRRMAVYCAKYGTAGVRARVESSQLSSGVSRVGCRV